MWHGTFKIIGITYKLNAVWPNCPLVKMQIGVISVISVITKLMIVKPFDFVGS